MTKLKINRPKAKDISKAIPKEYHLSGLEIEKSTRSDGSEYFFVQVKITHNEYITNPELFEPSDNTDGMDYLQRIENSRKRTRKHEQIDTPYFGFALQPNQLKIKSE